MGTNGYIGSVIDFGLSITEKTNDPNEFDIGTPGYIHPLYFGITKSILWKWTVDWYSIGKHLASLALKIDLNGELTKYIEEADNQITEHITDEEEKKLIENWINEILWLAILDQKVNLPFLKESIVEKYQILLGSSFFDLLEDLMKELVPKGKKLLFKITQRLGEEILPLLQQLCRWEYIDVSGLHLLMHPYFRSFQVKGTTRSFSNIKETIQIFN